MIKRAYKGLDPRVFVLPVVALGFYYAVAAAPSGEYWWHLVIGRFADVYGAIPAHNFVLYTESVDAPALGAGWLSQWWLFKIHEFADLIGAHYFRAFLGVSMVLPAAWVSARRESSVVLNSVDRNGWLAVACLFAADLLGPGPALFGAVLGAWVVALADAVDRGRLPAAFVAVLPLLVPFWVHVDTSFIVPALVAICYALFSTSSHLSRKVWVLVAGVSVAASFANPSGASVWMGLFHELRTISTPFSIQQPAFGLALVALLLGIGVHTLRAVHESRPQSVLVLVSGLLGVTVAPAFFGIVPAAFACTFAAGSVRDAQHGLATWALAIASVVVAVVIQPLSETHVKLRAELPGVRSEAPLAGIASERDPLVHVRALRSFGAQSRVFHEAEFAGLVAWELYSFETNAPLLFVDPRPEAASSSTRRLHAQVLADPALWRGIFQQYGVTAALLDQRKHEAVAASIAMDPAWTVLIEEDGVVLLVKRSGS